MKRPLEIILAILALTALQPAAAADALRPTDFDVRLPLRVSPQEGLHALELNEAIHRAGSTRTLADLRIFNASGEAMPWAVLPVPPPAKSLAAPVDLTLVSLPQRQDARTQVLKSFALRVEGDERRAFVEIAPFASTALPPADIGGYLIDARRAKDLSGQLSLVFDGSAVDYAERIEILGSDDLVNWRRVAGGSLTWNRKLGEPVERNTYDLHRPPPFLSVQGSGPVAPQIVAARFAERQVVAAVLPRTSLAVTRDDARRGSWLVDVPPALPIERLHFRPGSMNESFRLSVYRRDAASPRQRSHFLARRPIDPWVPVGQVDVMQIMRSGAEVRGAPLIMTFATDQLRLDPVESAHDSLPIVEAEWRPVRIAFVARGPGPYFLAIGSADAQPGPQIDLQTVLPETDRTGAQLPVATVTVGSADSLAAQAAQRQRAQRIVGEARWSRYVLWGALLAAFAAMAWMAWRLSVQLRRQP